MKPFPPTLKEKRRYIVFNVKCSASQTKKAVAKAINSTVLELIGAEGFSRANFSIIGYDSSTGKGMARSTNTMVDQVIVALSLVTNIQGKKAGVLVHSIAGTIKKSKGI